MSHDEPGRAPADASPETDGAAADAVAPRARVKAPRAGGPRRTPRPDRVEADDEPAPVLRAARPQGRPSSLPPPGFTPSDAYGEGATATVVRPLVDDESDATTETSRSDGDAAPVPAKAKRRHRHEPVEFDEEPVAAPKPAPGRRRGRRVKRTIRRIDLWSVLKLALVVYACMYAAMLGTLAALWGLLYSSGSVDKLESFMADVGLENYHFYGDRMFKACAAVGAVAVLAGTVVTVLATALVNVISEVTGGIRVTVIEEDV